MQIAFTISLKDINALIKANAMPIAAEAENMTKKFPTAEKNVSKELLSAYCSDPISRIVLWKKRKKLLNNTSNGLIQKWN